MSQLMSELIRINGIDFPGSKRPVNHDMQSELRSSNSSLGSSSSERAYSTSTILGHLSSVRQYYQNNFTIEKRTAICKFRLPAATKKLETGESRVD